MSIKKKLIKILVLGLVLINTAIRAETQNDDDANTIKNIPPKEKNKKKEALKLNSEVTQNGDQGDVSVEKNKTAIYRISIYTDYFDEKHMNTINIDNEGTSKPSLINNMSIEEITKVRDLRKRSVVENSENDNSTEMNSTKEECVGAEEYCNLTREEYEEMLYNYIFPHSFEWALIFSHTVVFIGGLVGNALVCVSVYRNHSMRTVTNYFIVNLAVGDFMVILFCLPPTVLWDVTETWFLGDAMCKMILYFQSVSVTVSVLTLTFISVDRWYAICFPLKFKSTTGRAKVAILAIWAISLSFNAPELAVLTTEKSVPLRFELNYLVQCVATWSERTDLIWHIVKIFLIYTAPLILMTVAYYQIVKVLWRSNKIPGQADTAKLAPAERTQLRSRRKAAKMLAAVVIMFAVCYFPVHLLSIFRYTLDMEQNDVITCFALISHVLCYANSAINPLIYNFMSGKFRREFRRAFCCPVESDHEHSTTLTRLTTRRSEQVDSQRYRQGYVCQSTLF